MAEFAQPDAIVIGATCLDVKAWLQGEMQAGTSNPAQVRLSAGGCARNIAESLARLGMQTTLMSVVGDDDVGDLILHHTADAGVDISRVLRIDEEHSATYIALYTGVSDLHMGIDDTQIIQLLTPECLVRSADLIGTTRMLVIDANLPVESAWMLLRICEQAGIPVALDPASYSCALRYRDLIGAFTLATPNAVEASALTGLPVETADQAVLAARKLVAAGLNVAIITLGSDGLVYASPDASGYVPAMAVDVVDPTGAGDALTAAVVYALLHDIPLDEAVRLGVSAATLTLHSIETVRRDLSLENLYAQLVI